MRLTKKQRQEKQKKLRQQWRAVKELSQTDEVAAIYHQCLDAGVLQPSLMNCALISSQAKIAGFEGLPYLDFKTYDNWKKVGFQVQKGMKSQITSITWIGVGNKENLDDDKDVYRFPKGTSLFHRSQVEAIN